MDSVVELRNVHKAFGNKKVLEGVSLDIKKGEVFYIIGKSGSGKSVILKHITRLMEPDAGDILLFGKALSEQDEDSMNEIRLKMGVLFQMSALFDSMTVFDNVAFSLRRFTEKTQEEIAEIVYEKLKLVGLSGIEAAKPADLSGGMQKRVGLARAIALGPQVVLYDEPTTGVDPILASAVDDLILSLNQELGVTSIVISHDMTSVFRTADRIAMLYEGGFLKIGSAGDFKESTDPVIEQFLAGSAKGPMAIL
jgi:phospholipid/cholesterol/gamma-HCH transport system ATP-binding protein